VDNTVLLDLLYKQVGGPAQGILLVGHNRLHDFHHAFEILVGSIHWSLLQVNSVSIARLDKVWQVIKLVMCN
jgi:hypothetical protein